MSSNQSAISLSNFQQLPAYAAYLLKERLDDYVQKQLQYSFEIDIPLLKFFLQLSEKQRYALSRQTSQEFLTYLSQNQASEQIETSLHQWKINQLPVVDRDSIAAEDITLINYVRKKSMMDFVTDYTTDTKTIIQLINEIDFFIIQSITTATNLYINLFKERLEEHSLFIQKVAETIPGAVYVFDATAYKGIYSNNKLNEVIGYDHADLNALGEAAIPSLIHPDDQQNLHQQLSFLKAANDGEVLVSKYRIKRKDGQYKWLANYESVFKRTDNGAVWQTIGITLDIDKQEKAVEELHRREQQLVEADERHKQAEVIANMGSWNWEVSTGKLEWSDQLYRIYGLQPQEEEITIQRFLSFVHPQDKAYVEKGVHDLITETVHDYTFRIVTTEGTKKWLRSIAHTFCDEAGKIISIIGTEQDVTEKEELIERLQQSEKLYKQAQSLTHMGNWTWDLVTNESTWSDELFEIYELPKGKPPSQDQWLNFLPASERDRLMIAFRECVDEHKPMDVTHQLVLPNGKLKTLHRKGEAIYDGEGKAVKLTGTTQDATQQYKTQAELKESQIFIRKITDATPSIISTYNVNTGAYTFISEGMYKLLGYQPHEIMDKGLNFFNGLTHPDDLPSVIEKRGKALAEANADGDTMDTVIELTYRLKHKNGHYRWFHTYGTIFDRNSEGKVEHVLNISLDVTDQQEAIATIKEQEYFIQQLADASPTILYLFDVPSQSFSYINREAFFVLGYLPDEILDEGASVTELLYHPDDMDLLPCRRQSTNSFQQVDSMIQYECRMKHKDGEYRWLLVREIVFKMDDAGAITQITGAALDINRRKEMEKTILQNTLQLEQSNASLEEFAYVASHDLKEPLRKISTFGDRLAASQVNHLTDEGKVYLRKIIDASQRMQNMISDLLSISMISGNRSFETYSLEKILEETLQTLEIKIEQQNAVIHHDRLPDAKIVPLQFRQLFQNLISNSLKFVREGLQPEVSITCRTLSPEEAAGYQVAKAEGYFTMVFADNGIGFEKEYAQKIFAIFQRLHGRSEYEGSGIGLAICKKIVEHHGGVIFATSQPNAGATFTIILPV